MYESEVAEKVQDTFGEYREAQSYKEAILSTAATLEISKVQIAGLNVFFVKHFSLKKASEFPIFSKGFSLL